MTTMTEELPHRNLYTRLKASAHGVGVFAIRDIPEGLRLFKGDAGTIIRVPISDVEQLADSELRRMYFDFCPTTKGAFVAPADFNQLTMSWYMNHSPRPNVHTNENLQFAAARPITAGEELTIDYAAFSDHAVAAVAEWSAATSKT